MEAKVLAIAKPYKVSDQALWRAYGGDTRHIEGKLRQTILAYVPSSEYYIVVH